MAQLLTLRPPPRLDAAPVRAGPLRRNADPAGDPGAAARGILVALGLSAVLWVALALLVPRLW